MQVAFQKSQYVYLKKKLVSLNITSKDTFFVTIAEYFISIPRGHAKKVIDTSTPLVQYMIYSLCTTMSIYEFALTNVIRLMT